MNELNLSGGSPAITSAEIAELVGKRHDNVKRTIESLAETGVIGFPQIEEIPTATKPTLVFKFAGEQGKRDSIVVVAQLSPEFTARLVDRWQQLEAAIRSRPAIDPTALSKLDVLKLAIESEERRIEAEAKVAELTPKAAALDRLCKAEGAVCITVAAKDLQVRPKDLFRWLQANGWIYRRPGGSGWIAYQPRLQQGVLAHKVTTVERSDGTSKQVEQVLVTSKGLARIAELLQGKAA